MSLSRILCEERGMKHKQGEEIFITIQIGNLDNTFEFDDDVPRTFDTEEKAINNAKEITEEYGMRMYVYKCTPIIKVDKGKIRITKL